MLVDSHAHLDFVPQGLTVEEWLERAREEDVSKIISVGTSISASRECVEIAEKLSKEIQIFASVGIHAEDGKDDIEKYGVIEKCIEELSHIAKKSKKVIAIGECGFDIRRSAEGELLTTAKEKGFQKELFVAQISLAQELSLPLIIHCRDAWQEAFEVLPRRKVRGVFHSWTGDLEAAEYAIELGFFISFSGIVTFKNAPKVAEVASKMRLDRMLVETDSPFLSPEPFRGLGNEPKNVKIIAQFIASLRNLNLEKIAEVTSWNTKRLFDI